MLDAAVLVGVALFLLFGDGEVAGLAVLVDEGDRLGALLVGRDAFVLFREHTRGVDVLSDHHEIGSGHVHFASSLCCCGLDRWSHLKKVFAQALVLRRA